MAKIIELNSKVSEAERTTVEADEARRALEVAKKEVERLHTAKLAKVMEQPVAEYRAQGSLSHWLTKKLWTSVMTSCAESNGTTSGRSSI